MKPYLLAFVCTVLSIISVAQDTTRSFALQQPYHPVFRITSDDIENLPFTNIMEVLNASFPFVFSDPPYSSGYTYMVDGRIMVNPNAINVIQVSSIEFFPVSFDMSNGYRSDRGTFVITTKAQSGNTGGLRIRSQTGLLSPSKYSFYGWENPGYENRGEEQIFTNQELAYGLSEGRFTADGSVSYSRSIMQPSLDRTVQTVAEKFESSFDRFRFSSQARFDINKKLTLTGGAYLVQGKGIRDYLNEAGGSRYDSENDRKTFYFSGNAGLNYAITPKIRNIFMFEFESAVIREDQYVLFELPPPNRPRFNDVSTKDTRSNYLISNSISGVIGNENNVSMGWELLMRYDDREEKKHYYYMQGEVGGMIFGMGESRSKLQGSTFGVMPRLSLSIARRFMLTAGAAYESHKYKGALKSMDETFPFAGIRYSLINKGEGFSSLHLHATYGQTWNEMGEDLLYDYYTYTNPYRGFGIREKGSNLVIGTDFGFAKERLIFSVNVIDGKFSPAIYIEAPGGGYTSFEEVERFGFSAGANWLVLDKQKLKLRFVSLMFYEKFEFSDGRINTETNRNNNLFINSHRSNQVRTSLRLSLNAGRFFAQVQALLRANDPRIMVISQQIKQEEVNNHGMTFLTAGYNFPLSGLAKGKNVSISLQARNLAPMKYAGEKVPFSVRYYGIGILVK